MIRSAIIIIAGGGLGYLVGRTAARQAASVEAAQAITPIAALRDVQGFTIDAFEVVTNLATSIVSAGDDRTTSNKAAGCGCGG